MTRGQYKRACRLAMQILDEWLEVTGIINFDTSTYGELESIIENAVDIGAKTALNIPIDMKEYSE